MDKWRLIHRYNRLVRIGEAKPLSCPDCEMPVVVRPDLDDEPRLLCAFEDRFFLPGTMFWADVNAVVAEHYV